MVEIVSLKDHLCELLLNSCWQFQLKLPQQFLELAYVHLFERRGGIKC